MPKPSEIFRRTEIRMPKSPNPAPEPKDAHAKPAEEKPLAPQIPEGHANYTALMRKHDRMKTRHV